MNAKERLHSVRDPPSRYFRRPSSVAARSAGVETLGHLRAHDEEFGRLHAQDEEFGRLRTQDEEFERLRTQDEEFERLRTQDEEFERLRGEIATELADWPEDEIRTLVDEGPEAARIAADSLP